MGRTLEERVDELETQVEMLGNVFKGFAPLADETRKQVTTLATKIELLDRLTQSFIDPLVIAFKAIHDLDTALSNLPANQPLQGRAITTVDELRQTIVSGLDRLQNLPLIRRFISDDEHRLMSAQRSYWQNDDGTQLTKLLGLLNREP